MSNNRDFSMRAAWTEYLEELSDEEEIYFFGDEPIDTVHVKGTTYTAKTLWDNFKRKRPVTAHLLEEMFGREEAWQYVNDLNFEFTEEKAVQMVTYVYNSPKKVLGPKKNRRIDNIQIQIDNEKEE